MNAGRTRAAVREILGWDADFEADQIICAVTSSPRASIHAHPEAYVSRENYLSILELARRRLLGEPLAYVLGDAFFCGRRFTAGRGALIPRPETEILTWAADEIMKKTQDGGRESFADWCTGSGCIAITLLLENPCWTCFAVDSSADALLVARENAAAHGVDDRINFILCETPRGSGITPESLGFVTTNPPYIPTNDIASLETQVRDYEPQEALDGGPDGLRAYRMLLSGLPRLMKPGASLLLETGGDEQSREVRLLAHDMTEQPASGGMIEFIKIFPDHRGIGRFMLWKKRIAGIK